MAMDLSVLRAAPLWLADASLLFDTFCRSLPLVVTGLAMLVLQRNMARKLRGMDPCHQGQHDPVQGRHWMTARAPKVSVTELDDLCHADEVSMMPTGTL